ncbi:hypothetical protein K439DRAFT_1649780 [Ramaria rubella]|nr:hypothetical protein K439DRAFT_1649780 [Ramaria rubella]
MPQQTECQALTNDLLELFLIQKLAEGQAEFLKLLDDDSDASDLLHVSLHTFDALLLKVQGHPVFQNNLENEQISVDSQVAIILYRLGHFGNATSMQKVGLWVGYGYGTGFRRVVMRWPNERQKEEASNWVESRSCLMVDGTMVPLFACPGFYGNSWYDCKRNYSLNVQHDATAWKATWVPQEHNMLLGTDEWVWADTAYPLQRWCQAPYKR